MKAAIYARVSTDSQQQRGTIGSQLEVLRERLAAEGVTNWLRSSATTGIPVPGWTGQGWTACETPPKPV
jgi:hypothetical protein